MTQLIDFDRKANLHFFDKLSGAGFGKMATPGRNAMWSLCEFGKLAKDVV